MLSPIQIVKRSLVKSLVVKTSCSIQELPAVLGNSFQKVAAYMEKEGLMSAGAPYVAYFNQDMENLIVEIGIPVGMYAPDTDEIKMSEIPEGQYLQGFYTGPYSGLKEAYSLMTTYMVENKKEVTGAVYESYLNDPGNTPEDKLETEILFKI